jgi:hypothetical protein
VSDGKSYLLTHAKVIVLLFNSKYAYCLAFFHQVFGAKFTKRYLRRHLEEPLEVHVENCQNNKVTDVKMKMGLDKRNAIITSGWEKVRRRMKLQTGDIYIFCFHKCPHDGEMYLLLVCLPE